MALASLTEYLAKIVGPHQRISFTKASQTGTVGVAQSTWLSAGFPGAGAAPTTAAVPTRSTAGALGQFDSTTAGLFAWFERIGVNGIGQGTIVLIDRLSHQGGLSAIDITAQATNLPTAALTRYTTGEGVRAALEIYTIIGTTATTVTCSYTDQDGTAGNTSQPIAFGATGRREVGRFMPMSLAAGDTGVRAVATVTVLATTGTAGAFGVTLYKPLIAIPAAGGYEYSQLADPIKYLGGHMPEVVDDACLSLLWLPGGTSSSGVILGDLNFLET